jgi:hypothetical protein
MKENREVNVGNEIVGESLLDSWDLIFPFFLLVN